MFELNYISMHNLMNKELLIPRLLLLIVIVGSILTFIQMIQDKM